jgi:hypothetical protein
MENRTRIKEAVMRLFLIAVAMGAGAGLSGWASEQGSEGNRSQDKGLDRAQAVLSEKEHSKLGLFVVTELDNGVRGKALAEAIHQELALLKAERDADKPKKDPDRDSDKNPDDKDKSGKGPGEALKHGLKDKDITNFGKFVNEQHAAGLRGEELADAIQKRHEELKAEKTADHLEDHPNTPHHNRHRSAGKH